mgnify:CR=1 FL=1
MMVKALFLSLVALVALTACAPVYYCETVFGLANPPVNADGNKYWESTCYPQSQYDKDVKK